MTHGAAARLISLIAPHPLLTGGRYNDLWKRLGERLPWAATPADRAAQSGVDLSFRTDSVATAPGRTGVQRLHIHNGGSSAVTGSGRGGLRDTGVRERGPDQTTASRVRDAPPSPGAHGSRGRHLPDHPEPTPGSGDDHGSPWR
jgi:hypothetical protein